MMADSPKPPLKVQSSPGSPSVSGAIKDAIGALANAFAPRSVVQRPKKIASEVDAASGSPQTNDLGDQF